jgi:hypothetical protein
MSTFFFHDPDSDMRRDSNIKQIRPALKLMNITSCPDAAWSGPVLFYLEKISP